MLARGIRPYEMPINYKTRSREEGKKLTWGDGVVPTKIMIRVRLQRPSPTAAPAYAGPADPNGSPRLRLTAPSHRRQAWVLAGAGGDRRCD
jgi:hypothetical protein